MIEAVLLLGATGAGKSPLGDHLEEIGWQGRRCHHLDFGALLRAVSSGRLRPAALTEEDVTVVRRALERGALLEDHEFPIAAAILRDFLTRPGVGAEDLVVLNGLPRHIGQAEAVEGILDVALVVYLEAAPKLLIERIHRNAGGDRGGRADDDEASVLRRVERFRARTVPLLERYANRVRTVRIELDVGPEAILRDLAGA